MTMGHAAIHVKYLPFRRTTRLGDENMLGFLHTCTGEKERGKRVWLWVKNNSFIYTHVKSAVLVICNAVYTYMHTHTHALQSVCSTYIGIGD